MLSSLRVSEKDMLYEEARGDRAPPVLRSRIVKVQSEEEPEESPLSASLSPAMSDAELGEGVGYRGAGKGDRGNGYSNVRSLGSRSPRSPRDRRDVRRSKENVNVVEARAPLAIDLISDDDGPPRERQERNYRGKDDRHDFNSPGRGRGFDKDNRGSYRDSERLGNTGSVPSSRDRYRDRDGGSRAEDDLVRREPDHFRFKSDAQDKRTALEPSTRRDPNGWGRDRDRSRDRDRDRDRDYRDRDRDDRDRDMNNDRNGGNREYGGNRDRDRDDMERPSGERWRRHSTGDEAADPRRSDNYADDRDRRPIDRGSDRGRGRGGRGRGGGRGAHDNLPIAPPLYSIHKATVHSIRPFGMFVRIEGYRNHGLVHLSQVSEHEVTKRDDSEEAKIQALSSVAGEGEEVWIKVISVKQEEEGSTKIGCSMKYVNQGSGVDADPNNVQLEQQQSRPSWQEPQKLKLEAVYNVQCTRCGGHGHLKKECYSSGEKTYKLLSEDDDVDVPGHNPMKGKDKVSKEVQPINLQGGLSSQLLATGSVGRGRAMVQPAWMKHGIGVGGLTAVETSAVVADHKIHSDLPDKVRTVDEAMAVIAKLKEEKQRRKEERRKKKEKRHRSKEEKKDKHKRSRHRDEEREERHSSRKKHRA